MNSPPILALTQRRIATEYGEWRDSLDRRWLAFLQACGFLPLLLPNHLLLTQALLKQIPVTGFLLTGGDDIPSLGGDDTERSAIEAYLLNLSIEQRLPLLGVCRGMQVIQAAFGIPLTAVSGHVQPTQVINIQHQAHTVNSYHQYGTKKSAPHFTVWAQAADGVIKAMTHDTLPLSGVMWHPERLEPFRSEDIAYFKEFYESHPTRRRSRLAAPVTNA